jgi:hypothetical protein
VSGWPRAYRMAVSGNSAPQRLLQRRLLQSRSDWD